MPAPDLIYIAGPCVLESGVIALSIAKELQRVTANIPGVRLVFKASFDKANRTSLGSYRGPGLEAGLGMLRAVKEATGLPILSDVHDVWLRRQILGQRAAQAR